MGMDRARRMTPPGFAKRVVSVRVEHVRVCGLVKPLLAAHVILACKYDDMAVGTAQCLFVNCCCGDGVSLRLHWDKIACLNDAQTQVQALICSVVHTKCRCCFCCEL